MRFLTILCGGALIVTGLFCFANPGVSFLTIAFILGIILVVSGFIQGVAYYQGRRGNKDDNNSWIMVDAAITFILGIFVLSNQLVADVAIPIVFGMWVLQSGILRIVTATQINKESKPQNYYWTLLTGIVCALAGLYAFLNPILAGLATVVLLGIFFLLQGISAVELGIHMPHEIKSEEETIDYEDMTKAQLIEIAEEKNLDINMKLKKSEIVEKIKAL